MSADIPDYVDIARAIESSIAPLEQMLVKPHGQTPDVIHVAPTGEIPPHGGNSQTLLAVLIELHHAADGCWRLATRRTEEVEAFEQYTDHADYHLRMEKQHARFLWGSPEAAVPPGPKHAIGTARADAAASP